MSDCVLFYEIDVDLSIGLSGATKVVRSLLRWEWELASDYGPIRS